MGYKNNPADQGFLDIHDNISDYLTADDLAAWKYDGATYCPRFNGSATCQQLTFYDLMAMR